MTTYFVISGLTGGLVPVQSATNQKDVAETINCEESALERWFSIMLSGKSLYITISNIYDFLSKELNVSINNLEPHLITILPYLVILYLKKWPGWQLLKTDVNWANTPKTTMVNNLKIFLMEKLQYIITEGYTDAMKQLLIENNERAGNNITFAPYSLHILCPPKTMNALFFTEDGNDILVKEHAARELNTELTTTQLLHWPFVQVSFVGPELSFVRRQANEYIRYLNSTPHQYTIADKSIVESVEIENSSLLRRCFTYRLLKEYVKCYMESLSKQQAHFNNYPIDCQEVEAILRHFLQDILDMNLKGRIATNTRILFKLSSYKYARVKKMHKLNDTTDGARVGYCEVQVPKVELTLNYFYGQQKFDNDESTGLNISNNNNDNNSSKNLEENIDNKIMFNYLDKVNKNPEYSSLMPVISYHCTYCKTNYSTTKSKTARQSISEHISEVHKTEQPLKCSCCKVEFEITQLAAARWKHECTAKK